MRIVTMAMVFFLAREAAADFVDDFDDENGAPSGWTFVGTVGAVETAANSSVLITGGTLPNHGRLRSDTLFSFLGTTTVLTINAFTTDVAVLGIRDTVDGDAIFFVFENQGDDFLITSFSDGTFNFSSILVATGTGYTGGPLVMTVVLDAAGLTVTMDAPFFSGGTVNSYTNTWAGLFGGTNGFDPSQLTPGGTGFQLAVRDGTFEVGRIGLQAPVPEPATALLFGTALLGVVVWRRRTSHASRRSSG